MALPPGFLEELRARTPMAGLVGRRVRLSRSGRDWVGCCPFHTEKTPSFYVYADHFHCFGCGVHGDAVSFVMQSQGAGFMEAVEQLAAEAGLELPKLSPQAAEAERKRFDLYAVLEAAAASYQRRLFLPEGNPALGYLRKRGLTEDTIREFGLGWSGPGRGALAAELSGQGITAERLIEAGLMRQGEERPYDLFFNRILFPIRDARGRIISFGGRTLEDAQPKYLNGPETPLFSKRRSLYGLDRARTARADIVVVEGYMDVLALHQAGFGGAVAPLGTALTEGQLEVLWRLSPIPVLCFDGDAAGSRAAARAALAALPLLRPERTLQLASLPAGEDPDTLIQRRGSDSFRQIISGARPLCAALFGLLQEGMPQDTPEQRAAFRAKLIQAAQSIPDRALAWEYQKELLDSFKAQRRNAALSERRPASQRVSYGFDQAAAERLRILTAIILGHPCLLRHVDHVFETIELPPKLSAIRQAILEWATTAEILESRDLLAHLSSAGLAA
ncbi:MAG: DNA primase, partial [Acetobacteraceae bacterium]|nr:DNA primase [Acetobacteraceae bacterium]